jgi:DNA-binding phage protein
MALTRDFKELIRDQAQTDPAFRKTLLREAIEYMLNGDVASGKAALRNYINATVGFPELEKSVNIPATSLMRMFGPKGNPTAANIFGVLAELQKYEGVHFEIHASKL